MWNTYFKRYNDHLRQNEIRLTKRNRKCVCSCNTVPKHSNVIQLSNIVTIDSKQSDSLGYDICIERQFIDHDSDGNATIKRNGRQASSSRTRRMAQHSPRYKSEVFVPIRKDSKSFEERQKSIWEEMQERMEKRRREWEDEADKMRSDFFKLKATASPSDRRPSSENLLESRPLSDIFYDDSGTGNKKFCVSFDVSQFKPEEISVRTQENKLVVNAKHEEKGEGRSLSREFSRSVDIPKQIDPDRLACCLSNDGILQIEAPVPAPIYDTIEQSVRHKTSAQPRAGPVVVQHDGSKKFRIVVDIGHDYLPQDVTVKTIDKKLVLNARHEEKSQGRSSVKSLSREFDLPEVVDPNTVTASLTDDGKLVVEAPISNYAQGSYTGKLGSTKQPKITISVGKQ